MWYGIVCADGWVEEKWQYHVGYVNLPVWVNVTRSSSQILWQVWQLQNHDCLGSNDHNGHWLSLWYRPWQRVESFGVEGSAVKASAPSQQRTVLVICSQLSKSQYHWYSNCMNKSVHEVNKWKNEKIYIIILIIIIFLLKKIYNKYG